MNHHKLEPWRRVWRKGFAPILPREGLLALRDALRDDSSELCQGYTIVPPPLLAASDHDVEKACAVALCGWKANGSNLVGDVEAFFAAACHEADLALGETGATGGFLSWFDETPRREMIRELLPEVELELARRKAGAVA